MEKETWQRRNSTFRITHQQEKSHWNTFATGLSELGSHIRELHKEVGLKGECKVGDAIDRLVGAAGSHAQYHGSQAEACAKASYDDLNKLVPTQVSAINPAPHIRPVPRAGALPLRPNATDPRLNEILGIGSEGE